MLIFVIICNVLLTLFNFYLVGCIRQWRRKLREISLILEQVEGQTRQILALTPEIRIREHRRTATLQKRYQQGLIYLKQTQQICWVLGFTLNLWRGKRNR